VGEPDDLTDRDRTDRSRSSLVDDAHSPRPGGDASAAAEPRDDAPHGRRRAGHRRRPTRRELPLWQEMIVLLAIALGLAIVLKSLFVQAFYIPSASMHDTLIEDDRILVEKPSYWFDEPQRGDIVVFDDPGGWLGAAERVAGNPLTKAMEFVGLYPSGNHLVKRVIGVGGDRVTCCDGQGRIRVNGVPLDESEYLPRGVRPSEQDFRVRVPEGELWVMGDNRPQSADSRAHLGDPGGGTIDVDDVVGRVFVTVWPLDRAELTDEPQAFDRLEDTGRQARERDR
jgi:signal peptidase I